MKAVVLEEGNRFNLKVNISRMPQLMGLVETGRVDLSPLTTHVFPLAEALEAYDLFENHKEQCIKVLLKP